MRQLQDRTRRRSFAYSRPGRGLAAVLAGVTALACGTNQPSGPDDGSDPIPPVQSLRARIAIDGAVDLSDFETVRSTPVQFKSGLGSGAPTGATATVRWGVLNDEYDLYLGFVWPDADQDSEWSTAAGPIQSDGILVAFDDDGDGVLEVDEDQRAMLAVFEASQWVDQHMTASGPQTDVVGDGVGRLRYDAVNAQWEAEFLISLGEDTRGDDGAKSAATRIAFQLLDGARIAEGTGAAGDPFGPMAPGVDTSGWPTLDLLTANSTAPPQLPGGLTGLIAFISDHEGAQEIYTFDPGTRLQRRIPTPTELPFKDAVSLSHDRTRVAFHAGPSPTDYAAFEIYTINIDGSDLRQLTNNSLLDGHPAWSLDDSTLAYASFRDGGQASIVLVDTNGQELADLTPSGSDDNDPEFAPDGRIIIKTTRFSAPPLYRMAIMNDDGSGVIELTSTASVSDHDGTSDGEQVFFERFMKDTNFSTDPESFFASWNVIGVQLDGSSEVTLVADGWVNWLPVPDPTGAYLIYLKSVGYTEARLIDMAGMDFGRLIPGATRISYLDWK